MRLSAVIACVLVLAAYAPADTNMIRNGGFEIDTAGKGMADDWRFEGDSGVTATWSREAGVEGQYSQKLDCTAFHEIGPASHAMLAQYDAFALREGQWYRLSFWAKAEKIPGNAVNVAISNTENWTNCGLFEGFRVRPKWEKREFAFHATQTISAHLRLQIWYTSTGTLWIDDVRLEPTEPVARRFTEALADAGGKNLVPNSSFECGTSGWGSITDVPGWGGNMNSLFGDIDHATAAKHGSSFKIAVDRRTVPVYYFDYYDMYRAPVLAPRVANRGWITVTPGADYTLSAYVKAAPAGTPCALMVYHAFAGQARKDFEATAEWQRVILTFKPSADQVFVAMGPDLTKSELQKATAWIDGVQLERGAAATDYEPRAPVEVGIEWERPGHLFAKPDEARATVTAFNAGGQAREVAVRTKVTDFHDRAADGPTVRLNVAAGKAAAKTVALGVRGKGAYRVALACDGGAVIPARSERFAVIQPCADRDGLFGMNHAYPWAELNRLSKQIGLTWFRDWSLKWTHVEPEKGRFEFAEPDYQIDRVLKEGLHVIGLLPFPSSDWSSTAPASVPAKGWPGVPWRGVYMPRDLGEFQDYVRATVRHYAGRIDVWEIMNEPVYTEYALTRSLGYKEADYVKLLEAAYKAVKEADPKAMVIGGIAGGPTNGTADFIAAGGLKWIDAINIHTYPGMSQPESYLAGLRQLDEGMEKAGGRKPIWDTEGAYYSNDDMPYKPFEWWGGMTYIDNEKDCAAMQVRLDVLLISYGTRKIIYHSGTIGTLNNEDMASIFFEWDGAPRKMAATQAALTALLGPDTAALGAMREEPRVYGFRSRGKTVVVAWDETGSGYVLRPGQGARLVDIVGNEIKERSVALDEEPRYVVMDGEIEGEKLKAMVEKWIGR
jgi:hypothetical protein